MQGRTRSPVAALAFCALTVPFGIAAHLISELFGLGWHDDADVVLSARHAYLALLALAALASLILALLRVPHGERRARVASLVEALPYRGSGARFVLLAFGAQFGFFALTQIGEGCPLCGGDVLTGVVAAAFAAALGAIVVTLCKRRVLEFVLALVWEFVAAPVARVVRGVAVGESGFAPSSRRSPFAFRYRPPPLPA